MAEAEESCTPQPPDLVHMTLPLSAERNCYKYSTEIMVTEVNFLCIAPVSVVLSMSVSFTLCATVLYII
jgi:hypothetical protein